MLIDIIAGARPNFMKIAPIIRAIQNAHSLGKNINYRLIHTGQHYDEKLSETFFTQLNIPSPDINMGVGSGSQAVQTANIMISYEEILSKKACVLVVVVGDVNSTMACAIVAKKAGIAVAHVEAGIRSFDLSMPEEINRLVTDSIADYFFTTTELASQNLGKAGIPPERIFFVGNTMIDTLLENLNKLKQPFFWQEYNLKEKQYIVTTLHRPANVDNPAKLEELLKEIAIHSNGIPIVFPVHPRTKKNLENIQLPATIYMTEPLGYHEFIYLVKHAKAVVTDSGGIQEETTVLAVPCITLRDNTERPETVRIGTNELIGTKPEQIGRWMQKLFKEEWKKGSIPALWDGKTAERIVHNILKLFNN